MEELFKLMRSNNIDTRIIDLFNIHYFTKDMIDYIKNLGLEGHQLKLLIYLISLGVFEKTNEKEYYKIIRAIKKSHTIEEDKKLELIWINNKYK